jgi:hypothetical protein
MIEDPAPPKLLTEIESALRFAGVRGSTAEASESTAEADA